MDSSTPCTRAPTKPRKELDAEVIFTGPTTPTAEGQIEVLNSLIAQRVDAIAVSANDPDALVPTLKRAMERGIKVVSYDSAVAPRGPPRAPRAVLRSAHRRNRGGADRGARAQVARARASSPWCRPRPLPPIRIPGSPKCARRWPQHPGLELVSVVYGDDVSDKSYREAVALLKQHPDLAVLVSISSVGIVATARAVEDQGLTGKVKVTGLGLPSELAGYVRERRGAEIRDLESHRSRLLRPRRSPRALRAVTMPAKPVSTGRMGEVDVRRGRRRRDEQAVHLRRQQRGGIREDLLTAGFDSVPPILTLTDIRKSFGGVRALERREPRSAARRGHRAHRRERRRKIHAGEDPLGRSSTGRGRNPLRRHAVRIAHPPAARASRHRRGAPGMPGVRQPLGGREPVRQLRSRARAGSSTGARMRARAQAVLRELDADFDADMPAGRAEHRAETRDADRARAGQ